MIKFIHRFKNLLNNTLKLAEESPGDHEKIHHMLIDQFCHTNTYNTIAGYFAVTLSFLCLKFFQYDWKLYFWSILGIFFYFIRYVITELYTKGKFFIFKTEKKRYSDEQLVMIGILTGLFWLSLFFITMTPPYLIISQLVVIFGLLTLISASLSLGANVPLWYFPFIVILVPPMVLTLSVKGSFYTLISILITYYVGFIIAITLRSYKEHYLSYLFRYKNKTYLTELETTKEELGNIIRILSDNNDELMLEIRKRKNIEKKMRKLASTDVLTGVTNRTVLQEKITNAINHAKRNRTYLGFLFLDLDKFKFINDTFGHHIGDELLKSVAQRLKQNLRSTDEISRIGGDEFLLILTNLENPNALLTIAQSVLAVLKQPYHIQEKSFISNVSIGISIYPQDGESPECLIRNADIAMYHAKENGGNTFFFYTERMNESTKRHLEIHELICNALDHDTLHFRYQPIISLKTGEIVAAEALIRFTEDETEQVKDYIMIAEESNLIEKIGLWELKNGISVLKRWSKLGLSSIGLTLNISVKYIETVLMVSRLQKLITEQGIDPKNLEFEITETQALQNKKLTLDSLNQIVKLGISLSLDDFGTDYSNLSYLRELPIKKLKIDQSFLTNYDGNDYNKPLIQAIISLSKALNLQTIAEGVETKKQLQFLMENQCDYVQGFFFSEPLSEEDFVQLVKENKFKKMIQNDNKERCNLTN